MWHTGNQRVVQHLECIGDTGRMETSHEPGANFAAKQGEPFTANDDAKWLSAAQVAQLEGISKRAVQNRCKRGFYRVRRVDTAQGEAWEIDTASIKAGANLPTNDEQRTREPFTAKRGEAGANFAANTQPDAAPDYAARYCEQLERENAFLRAQVEEGNRNAAELRAALREALKAQPRQLAAPDAAPESPLERAQIVTLTNTPSPTPEAIKTPKREMRPLWKVVFGIR